MMASSKQPPVFDPDGGDSYQNWKNDVKIWCILAKDMKIKEGPAVYLSLKGDAREAVRSLTPDELAKDTGVDEILKLLDNVYLKDESTRAFCAVKEFVEFRRESGQSFPKFLIEFNTRLREVKKYKLNFDDGILAYFLLTAANLSDEHERLVRATAALTFNDVKDKLQKVFGELDGRTKQDGELHETTLPVKDCLYGRDYSQRGRGRGRGGRGSYGQSFGATGSGYGQSSDSRGDSSGGRGFNRGQGGYRGRGGRGRGNPSDTAGQVMRCHICDSTRHFASDCQHRNQTESANIAIHLTLVAGNASIEQRNMLLEGLARAVLDCGCTKTVAGDVWVNEYLSMLSESERNRILNQGTVGKSMFRFGDGKEVLSKKELNIPVRICDKKVDILVDVVDADIPLLLGRPTMSDMGMVIDFANHTLTANGEAFTLELNSSGHYTIPVCEWTDEKCHVVFHAERLKNSSLEEKVNKAKKLHKQFAHASKERLIRLLKSGGVDDQELFQAITAVCDDCLFCQKYRRPKSKPIVAFPKAERFNQHICMDLKEVIKGKLWILHLIDSATRYTAATLINTKKKDVVVYQICRIWLSYFGSPRKIHSDCGGEFVNSVFLELNVSAVYHW
jgi:hypothetical protein